MEACRSVFLPPTCIPIQSPLSSTKRSRSSSGMHKHFRMIALSQHLRNHGFNPAKEPHTRIPGIWKKLGSLYNLEALDERVRLLPTPLPNTAKRPFTRRTPSPKKIPRTTPHQPNPSSPFHSPKIPSQTSCSQNA